MNSWVKCICKISSNFVLLEMERLFRKEEFVALCYQCRYVPPELFYYIAPVFTSWTYEPLWWAIAFYVLA